MRSGYRAATSPRHLPASFQNIKDPEIEKWVAKNWGAVRTSSAEKQPADRDVQKSSSHRRRPARKRVAWPRTLHADLRRMPHMFGVGGKDRSRAAGLV